MPAGDDGTSSELETQFVAQSGDEDVLWTVEEITAERGNKYRVKWAGKDPGTGKPWAQSWVAKHDCTSDLVVDWKAKKKSQATKKKQGRGTSGTSRSSGASKKWTSSSPPTSGTGTRRQTDNAMSSRLDPVQEEALSPAQPPSRSSATKRKRPAENSASSTARVGAEDETQGAPRIATRSSAKGEVVQPDTQNDGMASRPSKKQKTIVEVLLPPISSDDDSDALSVPLNYPITTGQNELQKTNEASLDAPEEDEDDRSPTRGKSKQVPAKGSAALSGREERLSQAKTKTKDVSRRNVQGLHAHSLSTHSEDEELRPHRFKKKATPKDKPPSEEHSDAPEKGVESVALSIKVGPPRGVKRRNELRDSGLSGKPGPLRTKSRENVSGDERAPEERSMGQPDHEATPSSDPPPRRRDNRTSTPSHISIPLASPTVSPHVADLSPGAMARLELFDRMIANDAVSSLHASEDVPHDSHLDIDVTHDLYDTFDTPDTPLPHNLSLPPKPKQKPSKMGTLSGLVVPETESSNMSQSQSPRKIISLPTIAVIAPSASPSPQKLPPNMNRTSKKSTTKITPSAFRPTSNARSRLDEEAPPSSIESFPSPRRVGKGKQKAAEEDELQSSPSEEEGNSIHLKKRVQRKITDSQLRRRGKALHDQAQVAREAERQKNKKPNRLKMIDEIINATSSLQTKGTPPVFTNAVEDDQELRWGDVIDMSGGANSATLDTVEHSEVRAISEEERERLRIELRQEEEESTQEVMDVFPPSPEEPAAVNGVDSQMPPPKFSKRSALDGRVEDVSEHVEQPSADLVQASVIAQASQEPPRHSQTDPDPLQASQPPSSPAPVIPENLTDSPKWRLGEALSLLNVKSEEIERLERELSDERRKVQRLTAQRSPEPTTSVRAAWDAERAQWAQERFKREQEATLWETQRKKLREENESLSMRLAESSHAQAEASAKLAKLVTEQEIWVKEREVMIHGMAQRSAELARLGDVRVEHDESQSKCGAEKSLCVEEREKWEMERTALEEKRESLSQSVDQLTAAVASTKSALIAAETNRDFFREQYVRASEFVGNVREENAELERRVKIAEGQAQEGVAGIKALFEGRVKALQADVDRWKGLAALLQEKDRRTNDELRLRAAQAPELIVLCDRLSEDNKSLDADLRRLGRAQQRGVQQRNKLVYDVLILKKERASLRAKLSKLTRAADGDTSLQAAAPPLPIPMPIISDDDDPDNVDDPNDMPILPDPSPPQSVDVSFDEPELFPCMWRPLLRDQCQHIFDTKEDLERHMRDHYRELRVQ